MITQSNFIRIYTSKLLSPIGVNPEQIYIFIGFPGTDAVSNRYGPTFGSLIAIGMPGRRRKCI